MNKKWIAGFVILIGLLLVGGFRSVRAGGGWIVFTVESWPQSVTVDEPFTVRFALRQAGQRLLPAEDVFDERHGQPNVRAIHEESGERIDFEINATDDVGFYEVDMQLPRTGSWRWTIHALDRAYMPPLLVVDANSAVAAAPATTPQTSSSLPTTETYQIISIIGLAIILLAGFLGFKQKMRFAPYLGLGGVLICLAGILLMPSSHVEATLAQPEPSTPRRLSRNGRNLVPSQRVRLLPPSQRSQLPRHTYKHWPRPH